MNPLETLREKYWINIYYSDKPNAPICNIVLVDKQNKDLKFKYPVWRDKEKEGMGYVGKLDEGKPTDTAKQNAYQPSYASMDTEEPPF